MKISHNLLIAIAVMLSGALSAQNTFKHTAGGTEIFLLSEGQQMGRTSILIGATEGMIQKYAPGGTFPNAVNAFLVRIGGKNILFDTGFGRLLFDNLSSAGITPNQIDAVVMTHLHGDHTGGLLKEGKAAFPSAKLYISAKEQGYWCDPASANSLPENRRGAFSAASAAVGAYGDRVVLFEPGDTNTPGAVLAGIKAVYAYGHTPGHTAYIVGEGKESILIWGDLTHAMALQMPYPSVAVTYDVDPVKAVESRKQILEYASREGIVVAGMHIAYPAMGIVTVAGEGYKFTPMEQ